MYQCEESEIVTMEIELDKSFQVSCNYYPSPLLMSKDSIFGTFLKIKRKTARKETLVR